jgi:release factor glutamine methyltransferase
MQLYLQFDRPLSDAQLDALRPLVKRRAEREPLQHITGSAGFLGLTFRCDRRALVPRPETETLADALIQRATAPAGLLVDVGTGTGVLALSFLHQRPGWRAIATDLSPDALALAAENAAALGLSDRVEFRSGDLLAPVTEPADIIASNPPYLPATLAPTLSPEVMTDPHSALFGGDDGLDVLRRLASDAPARLKPGGWLGLEFGDGQGPAVAALLGEGTLLVPDTGGTLRAALWQKPA